MQNTLTVSQKLEKILSEIDTYDTDFNINHSLNYGVHLILAESKIWFNRYHISNCICFVIELNPVGVEEYISTECTKPLGLYAIDCHPDVIIHNYNEKQYQFEVDDLRKNLSESWLFQQQLIHPPLLTENDYRIIIELIDMMGK